MAGVRVPPGSSCSLLSSPWLFPPSPTWTLLVIMLPVIRPAPKPPLTCLCLSLFAIYLPSPVPYLSTAQGHTFWEGGDLSHHSPFGSFVFMFFYMISSLCSGVFVQVHPVCFYFSKAQNLADMLSRAAAGQIGQNGADVFGRRSCTSAQIVLFTF